MPSGRIAAFALASCLGLGALTNSLQPAAAGEDDVSVGGVWVFKITRDAAGYSVEQRVLEVRKRITEVLSTPGFRTAGVVVSSRQDGSSALVLAGDRLVVTVTPQDAAGTGMTTLDLARQWAQRLAMGLSRALPDPNAHVF